MLKNQTYIFVMINNSDPFLQVHAASHITNEEELVFMPRFSLPEGVSEWFTMTFLSAQQPPCEVGGGLRQLYEL